MIYLTITERLGNQMFQYAYARAIQVQHPEYGDICIKYRGKKDEVNWWGNQLRDFCLFHSVQKETMYRSHIIIICYRITRKFLIKLSTDLLYSFDDWVESKNYFFNRLGIFIPRGGSKKYQKPYLTNRKNIWILGNSGTEIPEYFQNIQKSLVDDFKVDRSILKHNKELYEVIKKEYSICISIRKGDFLKKGNERFNVCTDKYFYSAMKYINNVIEKPVFVIFSDDIEWVKQNMSFTGENVFFENNNGQDPTWEKMRLMTACKSFIISNSTFSWWAAFLGECDEKKVIAPFPWRKNEQCNYLYMKNYIILDAISGKLINER